MENPVAPAAPAAHSPSWLVSRIHRLDAAAKRIKELREAAAAELVALGKGEYFDEAKQRRVLVVVPSAPAPYYDLYHDAALSAYCERLETKKLTPLQIKTFRIEREELARKIAGPKFQDLFIREMSFRPESSFGDLAPKLLSPAKAKALLALCRVSPPAAAAHIKKA